jgi:superfamily II DNA/RNA helicase
MQGQLTQIQKLRKLIPTQQCQVIDKPLSLSLCLSLSSLSLSLSLSPHTHTQKHTPQKVLLFSATYSDEVGDFSQKFVPNPRAEIRLKRQEVCDFVVFCIVIIKLQHFFF